MSKKVRLVWMDLEMSGLEPETDTILEVATIVTDEQLNLIEEGPNLVIHHELPVLQRMDEWCTKQHQKSGLWERVLNSSITLLEAETITLEFIKKHCELRASPLCGNSIHQDRRFLYKYMPQLSQYLHYRNIDVSTLKELGKMWYPQIPTLEKSGTHLALSDIHESIREMKYYREKLFIRE